MSNPTGINQYTGRGKGSSVSNHTKAELLYSKARKMLKALPSGVTRVTAINKAYRVKARADVFHARAFSKPHG